MKKSRRIGLALIPGVALLVAACGGRPADAAVATLPRSVRVAPVERESLSRPIGGTGTVGFEEEVTLAFKIGGVIQRVAVDESALVSAGDVLASLDLTEIDATVVQARTAVEDAERDLERMRRLYSDTVVTLSQLEDAEARVEVSRAGLATARVNRRYAVITAPAGGVILGRRAEAGETVAPGTPVLVLGTGGDGPVVRVGLADRDAVRVRVGDAATVVFEALDHRRFEGTVKEVAASSEPGTGTFEIEITLPHAGRLASGLIGSVEIRSGEPVTYGMVPIESLLEADAGSATVFALSADGKTAERRSVRIAFLSGDRVAITDGLDGVEAVVTDGAAYLRDGESVSVVQ